MRAIILYILINLISVSMALAAPNVSSISGTMSIGSIITVHGNGFGAENRTGYIVYDDFDDTNFWNGGTVAFEAWSNDGKDWEGPPQIENLFYSGEDRESVGQKTFQVHKNAAFFSNGWGFRKNVEKESSSTGVQGGRLVFNTPTKPTEVWIRYYQRWSKDWPTPWSVTESKQMYIQIGSWESDHDYIMPHIMKQWPNTDQAWWRIYNGAGSEGTCLEPSGEDCRYYHSDLEWTGPDKWIEVKYHIKLQNGSNDLFEWWLNGKSIMKLSSINLDSDNNNEYISGIQFAANFSGPIATSFLNTIEEYEDRDDMVVSKSDPGSVAAAFLSNNSNWNGPSVGTLEWCNGTNMYVRQIVGGTDDDQIGYGGWTNESIKFQLNTQGLDTEKPIYLYVTNWSGVTNKDGFNFGGVVSDPVTSITSPTNLRVAQ